MIMKKKNKTAFTLIELMVVIAIIAILALAVFISLSRAREMAEDTNRMTAISQLRSFFYSEIKAQDIDFSNLESVANSVGGGVREIICEYGDTTMPDCSSKNVLHFNVKGDRKEFCVSIELIEKDEYGETKFFCIDKDLSAKKYNNADHRCGDHNYFNCM